MESAPALLAVWIVDVADDSRWNLAFELMEKLSSAFAEPVLWRPTNQEVSRQTVQYVRGKALVAIGAMMLLLSTPLAGQSRNRSGIELQAYGFGGGGKTTGDVYNYEVGPTATFGAGAQLLFESGFALSGELELMDRRGSRGTGFHPSINLGYHFRGMDRTVVPFLSGGYTANVFGLNVGGGLQYWAWKRVGIRTEVKDHAFIYGGRYDVYELRLGLAFR